MRGIFVLAEKEGSIIYEAYRELAIRESIPLLT